MPGRENNLVQLVYGSTAVRLMADEELREILDQSRRNNGRDGVTGMLVYSEGAFLQVLEGPEETVESVFGRIAADPRHKSILRFLKDRVESRGFGEWSMGFARASRGELLAAPGSNDFLVHGTCLNDLEPSRARRLLQSFRANLR
jgi:hypothetical protein